VENLKLPIAPLIRGVTGAWAIPAGLKGGEGGIMKKTAKKKSSKKK